MLILPSVAKDWHLDLHTCIYLNKPLGLPATSGGWKGNKPTFREPSLFSSVPWLRDETWFSNSGLFAFQPPNAAGSPGEFYCIQSPWRPQITRHTHTHIFVRVFTVKFWHDSSHCVTIIMKPITDPSNTMVYLKVYKSAKRTHFSLWPSHHQALGRIKR